MMAELDILNGFAGKVISDCIDITVEAIRKADKNRKVRNQSMEARIYQVTIDALNAFPYNKYKKEEKVYDAAESILNELKRGNGDYIESVRLGLNMLSSEITGDICGDFLKLLCYEICKVENRDLAIGHIIFQGEKVIEQQQQMDKHMQEEFEESHQNEEKILREVGDIKDNLNRQKDYKAGENNEIPVENKAQYYADKWHKNVFLNNYDEEDERAGGRANVKLKDIYLEELLPPYILNRNQRSSYNLKARLEKYIVNRNDREMLLILGQPGIGKSTLITWIMNNLVEKKNEIFVYKFASDLKEVNWQGDDILKEILLSLRLGNEQLKNNILILDGFDEIRVSGDRERILNKLYQELEGMESLGNFSLIITCRENYVNRAHLSVKNYITLQAWNEYQIKSFCDIYEKASTKNFEIEIPETKINKILEKKEIFGIPLILYMVLALDITIEKDSSIVDVYDQIFSLEGGAIYDRCYDVAHRTNLPEIKKHIHRISQRIAFWIFENKADEAFISQKKFEEICETEMSESGEKGEGIQSDTLIGNFFKLKHSEGRGTDELQFVHRSIYEYFVAVYFFESICQMKSKEEAAGKLGELLKDGRLSKQILEFIKYKFDSLKEYNLSDITREVFIIMLRDGMTYHVKGKYKNIIVREMNIFSNMLEVVHLWNSKLEKLDNIVSYLQYNYGNTLNLSGAYLSGTDLRRADLSGAYLSGAYLSEAYLSGADLSEADLIGVDLSRAYLIGADLSRADLSEAYLSGAYLSGADLSGAYLSGADLSGTIFDENQVNLLSKEYDLTNSKVYISETEEIISYNEYCKGKQGT